MIDWSLPCEWLTVAARDEAEAEAMERAGESPLLVEQLRRSAIMSEEIAMGGVDAVREANGSADCA